MNLRIGIDARTLKSRRGIGNVVYHLLQNLANISLECSFVVYIDDVISTELIPNNPRFLVKVLYPKIYPIWEQVSLPLSAISDNLDILYCPGNSAPIFLHHRIKLVLSIMDVMFMFPASKLPKSPSWYQRIGRVYLKYVVPIAAKHATKIITISTSSRNDICQYIDVPTERVSVILLAANSACSRICDLYSLTALRNRYGISEPFILALGAIDPRKNTDTVLKSFFKFKLQHICDVKLVVVGLPEQGIEKYTQLAASLGIANEVVFAGFVTEEDLVGFYNAAELLVYPSLYEGFGLPVLEAMICGTAVITSPCGSIPEIAGDAVLMVDPNDVDAIAAAMVKLLTDKELHESLVENGKRRAELFSWQLAADNTFKVFLAAMVDK